MQPVLVRQVEPRDGLPMYEIIVNERRTRAARLAGLTEVPVLVRDVPDQAVAVMALIEKHPARGSQSARGGAGRAAPSSASSA